jgi:transposase-like protein
VIRGSGAADDLGRTLKRHTLSGPLRLVQVICGPNWPYWARRTETTGRKHTPEQIVRKLREADRMAGEGASSAEVAKALEVSEATVGRWRSQYGGMRANEAKELRQLRDENGRLKRMLADLALDNEILKEVARGKF